MTVVDNASSDNSPAGIEQAYPEVELIENGANLGFSRGNNRALREATESYLGLLNPDTEVDPGWLQPLVARLNADPLAGGVGAKLLHKHDRIPLQVTVPTFSPPLPDRRKLGVRFYGADAGVGGADVTGGAHGVELNEFGHSFRWTTECLELAVPVDGDSSSIRLELEAGDGGPAAAITVQVGGRTMGEAQIEGARAMVHVDLSSDLVAEQAKPAVECAGIAPLNDGSMRDRGTHLLAGVPWSAWDGPTYQAPSEVFAVKGAAVLYRRSMLESLGFLDDGIFMYYEDADLAWRARRRGWRFWYEPESVVRHEHAALSQEWSPGFVRNVEFGKLRMLGKNAPLSWVARHSATALKFALGDGRLALGSIDDDAARQMAARLQALGGAAIGSGQTWRLRNVEARLAPLDGREIQPFVEIS